MKEERHQLLFEFAIKLRSASTPLEFAQQGELIAALEPVTDRLLKRYKAGQDKLRAAGERPDDKAAAEAQDDLRALILFKRDMGAFQRVYAFLSQIFDYANTAIEKRSIFYRRLLPLLEFGREREGIDLSKVTLTHHGLRDRGKRNLPLGDGDKPKLQPLSETGAVREKEKALRPVRWRFYGQ
jgi:type I restriction enzyme R subunit